MRKHIDIVVVVLMLISFAFVIDVEENEITRLQEKIDKLERAEIAITDFNDALMVRNDELESANEQLLEFTKLYECKGL